MNELTLNGSADGYLLLSDGTGGEYRLELTPEVTGAVRQQTHTTSLPATAPSPREVQALLRSGLSVDQIAEQKKVPRDYVERFEGPVRAELEYILETAQALTLSLSDDPSGDESETFGASVAQRLRMRNASDAHWTSWREESSEWVVQLEYTSGGLAKDARWTFDPKRRLLNPANDDARSLASTEQFESAVAPRLRSVPGIVGTDDDPFVIDRLAAAPSEPPAVGTATDSDTEQSSSAPVSTSTGAAPVRSTVTSITARTRRVAPSPAPAEATEDLLEALRRKRGEPQSAPQDPSLDDFLISAANPETSDDEATSTSASTTTNVDTPAPAKKSNRPSMPSWDEIVFGSRGRGDDAS